MSKELADVTNTYNASLRLVPVSQPSPSVDIGSLSSQAVNVQSVQESAKSSDLVGLQVNSDGVYEAVEKDVSKLKAVTKTQAKVSYSSKQKVLSLDVETTGLNPWEYRMIVCSVWPLDIPKGQMVTFAGWDEEKLTRELFAYIEEQKPDIILAFNAKFECRCFVTRAMQYHIVAPWIWNVEWHDMMTMLEGGWKNGLSGTMPAGTEENWLAYFFGEVKPYNMDECFEGLRAGRLDEMIIRNRTCVQGQGDLYQLYQYCRFGADEEVAEEKPSVTRINEWSEGDPELVKCPVCSAINEIKESADPGQCWRCLAALPKPDANNLIRESVRPIDWAAAGYTAKTLAAAKKAGTYNADITLTPVPEKDPQVPAMERLIKLGIPPHA